MSAEISHGDLPRGRELWGRHSHAVSTVMPTAVKPSSAPVGLARKEGEAMLLTSDTLVQCFFFFCFFLLQHAPLYNTCQQKQQPNPHSHPHYLALNLEPTFQPQMCMSPERIYRYLHPARLGKRPVAKSTPAHATRSRAHTPAFMHKCTNRHPHPYLSALAKVSAPLAVVSTAARLLDTV